MNPITAITKIVRRTLFFLDYSVEGLIFDALPSYIV